MKANRVLIPVDDSEFSLYVLPHVTRIFSPMQSDLFLLRVVPKPNAVTVDERVVVYADQSAASAKAEAMATLQSSVRNLEKLGYDVTPLISFGDPAAEIERTTYAKGIDVIAMTTHARVGIDRWLHGSVAQQVVNSVDVPVLLYRAEEDEDGED